MRTGQKIRHYLALSARGELLAACERDLAAAEDDLRNMLRAAAKGPLPLRFKVVSRVVLGAPFAASVRREPGADTKAKRIVLSLEFDDTGTVEAFREALAGYLEQRPDAGPHAGPQGKPFGLGVDLPIAAADCWCPGEAAAPLFGTRRAALALIGEPALGPLRGQGVNVVVVDQGVDLGRLPAARRGGAWRKEDGKWRFEDRRSAMPAPLAGTRDADPRRSHGTMVARNVLAVAPEARIFDLPLLPPEIGNQRAFLKDAQLAAAAVYEDIDRLRSAGRASERWVIVNAWGVYDRRMEHAHPGMPCSCHSDSAEHPLNWRIWRHDQSGFDVVFAAGNCGGFCPKSRCGPDDRGPGRSVHGPNARPEVLTVGAVRVDGTWLGYSSQGPGPRPEPPEQAGYASPSQDHPPQGPEAARLAHDKPDLCAPSQFADDEDAAGANTGTSAACGIAAGAVAALRSGWSPCDLPPAMLRECLRRQARRPAGAAWNNRLGWGILDLGATLAEITRRME